MTEKQKQELADFLSRKEDLIDAGEYEKAIRCCPGSIRELLKELLEDELGTTVNVTYKQYLSKELPAMLREIVKPICSTWFNFFINKGVSGTSYKFFIVEGLTMTYEQAKVYITDELEKLGVKYNFVKVFRDHRRGAPNIIINIAHDSILR